MMRWWPALGALLWCLFLAFGEGIPTGATRAQADVTIDEIVSEC